MQLASRGPIAISKDFPRDRRTVSLEGMIERGEMFAADGIEDDQYNLTEQAINPEDVRLYTIELIGRLNNRDRMILDMRLNGASCKLIASTLYP